jgi:hypothetical protein
MVIALMTMGLLGALGAGYHMSVKNDILLNGSTARARAGFYAAEAGLNVGIADARNMFDNFNIPGAQAGSHNLVTTSRTADYALTPVNNCAPCAPMLIPAGQTFAGLNSIPYRYTIKSTATNPIGDQEAELGAEFEVHNIPVFQFLAFYAQDLYLMPAPNMNLQGRLHTNNDLYLNINSGAALTIGDNQPSIPFVQVSAANDIYRGGQKYGNSWSCSGTVTIDKLADVAPPSPDLDPLDLDCPGDQNPLPPPTLNGYVGSLKDGIGDIQVPPVSIVDIGGPHWDKADLRIALRLDQPLGVVPFSALCGGAPDSPTLFPIEVQDGGGARDVAGTNALWRMMCERRGSVFYNDVPVGAPNPPLNNTVYANNRQVYVPWFGGAGTSGDSVYRRVGEDTSGNGVVNNNDRNDDICPTGAGPAPGWTPSYCPWPNPAPPPTSWWLDTDYRRGGFYHTREQMWMYLLNVNIRVLVDWNEANGGVLFDPADTTEGGLVVFLTVVGPNSGFAVNNYGVRIFDGADLNTSNGTFDPIASDPTGLTVVSDQGIIVQGDYNERDWVPAAIIGDSLTILSQAWEVPVDGRRNDRKSSADLSTNRRDVTSNDGLTASGVDCAPNGCVSFTGSTTLNFNAAALSGVGPSDLGPGWYNGGLENYPKFLESWSSRTLNIVGSFVSLGASQHKINNWACGSGNTCNIYDPPVRAWNYDARFNQVENLPPLTPNFTYVQQRLYTRFYR